MVWCLNGSKLAQGGVELCHGCFGVVCQCCDEDECVLETQMHESASIESLDVPKNRSPTSMSTAVTECPIYEPALIEEMEEMLG